MGTEGQCKAGEAATGVLCSSPASKTWAGEFISPPHVLSTKPKAQALHGQMEFSPGAGGEEGLPSAL